MSASLSQSTEDIWVLCFAFHHRYELIIINLSIIVKVYFLQQVRYNVFVKGEVFTLKALFEFFPRDRATAIFIKVTEGCFQMAFLQVIVAL